jgi:hypothetical protein
MLTNERQETKIKFLIYFVKEIKWPMFFFFFFFFERDRTSPTKKRKTQMLHSPMWKKRTIGECGGLYKSGFFSPFDDWKRWWPSSQLFFFFFFLIIPIAKKNQPLALISMMFLRRSRAPRQGEYAEKEKNYYKAQKMMRKKLLKTGSMKLLKMGGFFILNLRNLP